MLVLKWKKLPMPKNLTLKEFLDNKDVINVAAQKIGLLPDVHLCLYLPGQLTLVVDFNNDYTGPYTDRFLSLIDFEKWLTYRFQAKFHLLTPFDAKSSPVFQEVCQESISLNDVEGISKLYNNLLLEQVQFEIQYLPDEHAEEEAVALDAVLQNEIAAPKTSDKISYSAAETKQSTLFSSNEKDKKRKHETISDSEVLESIDMFEDTIKKLTVEHNIPRDKIKLALQEVGNKLSSSPSNIKIKTK
jgi:hypothetical protein